MDGYVGIDVSKDRLDVLLLRAEAREGQHFTNTPTGYAKLHQWLSRRLKAAQVPVCLEATGQYSEGVAEFLHAQGYSVSLVNPAHMIQRLSVRRAQIRQRLRAHRRPVLSQRCRLRITINRIPQASHN